MSVAIYLLIAAPPAVAASLFTYLVMDAYQHLSRNKADA